MGARLAIARRSPCRRPNCAATASRTCWRAACDHLLQLVGEEQATFTKDDGGRKTSDVKARSGWVLLSKVHWLQRADTEELVPVGGDVVPPGRLPSYSVVGSEACCVQTVRGGCGGVSERLDLPLGLSSHPGQ